MKKRKKTAVLKNKELGNFVNKDRLFVQNSNLTDKQMRKMSWVMRMVAIISVAALLIAIFIFVFSFLIPYIKANVNNKENIESSSSLPTVSFNEKIEYDSLGLPVYNNDFSLKIINSHYPSTEDEIPELAVAYEIRVHKNIEAAFKMLAEAANKDNISIRFEYGFVSYEQQEDLYNKKVEELKNQGQSPVLAKTNAKKLIPQAGESDFQTGLCVKISNDSDDFESTDLFQWLNKNMANYGFVFRYPPDKTTYTNVTGDYTVIRYVGQENANVMRQLSMCLEEYSQYLNNR